MSDQQFNISVSDSANDTDVSLPHILSTTVPFLDALTNALGVPRNVLAPDGQILYLWENLPRLLRQIPPESVNESLARMCVAASTGLFDSVINYAWNLVIVELRERVRRFGLNIIPQIIDKDFDEKKLMNLRNNDLLELCLVLNLISEDAYFKLNQCRDIRNNFSASHPSMGQLDEYEVLSFLNRVVKIALQTAQNPQAVNIRELMAAVKDARFSDDQCRFWHERIENTYEAQRETTFGMLHGMYCDPSLQEHTRVNAISICERLKDRHFTPNVKSVFINRHYEYQAKGDTNRHSKSRLFFESLGILDMLSDSERHSMVTNACKSLLSVHNSFDNFYNEPPFAKRLLDLASQQQVPDSAKSEFVQTVITCSVGNQYGTSDVADEFYIQMVKGFSAGEIQQMLKLPSQRILVSDRINSYPRCKNKYQSLIQCLDSASIPASLKSTYERWT